MSSRAAAGTEFVPSGPGETVIPLVEERVTLGKRAVERGRVRVSLTTDTVEEVLHETLHGRRVEVTRVPVGREISEAPATREEDGVTIIPVVEEVLVVERRLVLKEEIHLRTVEHDEVVEVPATRRVQRAAVERIEADGPVPMPPSIHPTTPHEEHAP